MRTQTIDKYEYQLDRYAVPVLGNRRLNELTPALCQRLIEGQGSVRQAIPKTKAGERVITIPPFVVESLRELRPATATPAMPVFPSRRYRDDGTVLRCQAPSNCRRQLRAALAKVGMQGEAYPHLLRSTVATFVARKRGLLMQLRCSGTRSGPALRRGTT
jgi:integrase